MRFMCLPAFVPQITTCLRALNYCVPTRICAFIFQVPTCLHVCIYFSTNIYLLYIFYIYAYIYFHFLPTCTHFSCAYMPTTTHKIYCGSLLYLLLLFFYGLFDLPFHSKPQNKLLPLKLHTQSLSCGVLLSQLVHIQKQ